MRACGRATLVVCLALALVLGACLSSCAMADIADAPMAGHAWREEARLAPSGVQVQQEQQADVARIVSPCAITYTPHLHPQHTDAAWQPVLYHLLPLGGQAPPACLCVFHQTA